MTTCTCDANLRASLTGHNPALSSHTPDCPALGPTYTDLARENDGLKADNAVLLHELRGLLAVLWGPDFERRPAEISAQRVSANPHPGSALLDELENLWQRQALWEEAATTLYGYTVFLGPCVHGRDPWDRCDICGEESAVHALVRVTDHQRAELENLRKQVEALKQGQQRASEARHAAFLELAEDLAEMSPEEREKAIRNVIDRHGDKP